MKIERIQTPPRTVNRKSFVSACVRPAFPEGTYVVMLLDQITPYKVIRNLEEETVEDTINRAIAQTRKRSVERKVLEELRELVIKQMVL